MFVFDSDVLIDFLRGNNESGERVEFELKQGAVAVSAITAFELEAGAMSVRQQAAVQTLLEATPILPVSGAAARRAGEIFRQLRAAGQEIGMADCLIGATCLEHGMLLVTRNHKHFGRIPGLKLTMARGTSR